MAGNVWEWCQDRLDLDYYQKSPLVDPLGPSAGGNTVRRGGSYFDNPANCRSAKRYNGFAYERDACTGFRVVVECKDGPESASDTRLNLSAAEIELSETPDDPNREVAKWVVSHGGEVTVRCHDKMVEARLVADFPSEPFSVVNVDMSSCTYRPTDADVTRFVSLKELESLILNHTDLTDDGLRQISQIPSLRLLWCRSGSFTDEGIQHLARMPKLHNISLTFCTELTERGLAELCNPHMQFLYLSGQPITDTFMRNLSRCPQLGEIHLNATQISDAGLVQLGGLQSLRVLHLAKTNITDSGLAELAKLKSLRSLNVSETNVTDSGMAELAKCRELQELIIGHTRITDEGLSQLASLPNLKTLHAEETNVTDAGVASFRQAKPGCAVYFGPAESKDVATEFPPIKIGLPVQKPTPVAIEIKPPSR